MEVLMVMVELEMEVVTVMMVELEMEVVMVMVVELEMEVVMVMMVEVQQHNSKASIPQCLAFFHGPTLISVHDCWKSHSFDYMELC